MEHNDTKLHLGCGIVYKPRFINIDVENSCVADIQANALNLPFEHGTVALIEAYHLVEHFDLAHCHYVLAHLFRLLRPRGRLILETPDLETSFREFLKVRNTERKRQLLQWIYGVHSPGMGHKTGFDFDMLKTLLTKTGFSTVTKQKAITHLYESGMRVECRKPEWNNPRYEFFAEFRWRVVTKLNLVEDSMELGPLENLCIKNIRELLFGREPKNVLRDEGKGAAVDEEVLFRILAKAAVCSPELAMIFLVTAGEKEFSALFPLLGDPENLANIRVPIAFLNKIHLHQHLFSLWKKARKTPKNFSPDFEKFVKEKETRLVQFLHKGSKENIKLEKELEYIMRQPAKDIDFFHASTVVFQARILLNKGLKKFQEGNVSDASELFSESLSLNPDNPLVHWNLARVESLQAKDAHNVNACYEQAMELVKAQGRKEMAEILKKEWTSFNKGGRHCVLAIPVSEFTEFENELIQ